MIMYTVYGITVCSNWYTVAIFQGLPRPSCKT